jgi:CubicO group peptidase (beta-lactamase class C family)
MSGPDRELTRDLRRAAVEIFNEHTLAGLAVGLVAGGELAWFEGLGLADAERGRPVEARTTFRIGSISKTMTALAVMQLVEEGAVALDDPVGAHLRSFAVHSGDAAQPVTVRHLLTHTGGIGELRRWSDLLRPTIGLAAKPGQVPRLADYYAGGLRGEVRPGSKWAYANHGFAALGQLVEDVSGSPFAERLRERVFGPLGMGETDFERRSGVGETLAVGYHLKRGRLVPVKDLEIVVSAAGSVFSCVSDMALYAEAILGGGANRHGRAVGPETLAEMLRPQWPGESLPAMGLAFMLGRLGEHRLAGHDGGWPGFVSAFHVAPDDGVAVVVFTNTSAAFAPHDLAERILRLVLGESAARELEPVPESPHLWPELVGVYKPPRGPNTNFRLLPLIAGEIEVTVRRGTLVARAVSPVKALRQGLELKAADPADPLVFLTEIGEESLPVVFERGAGGRVEAVRAGSTRGGFVRLVRRPRATSTRLWGTVGAAAAASGALVAVAGRSRRRRGEE